MPAPTRQAMNQGVLTALRNHLQAQNIHEFDFHGPEYTSTIVKLPVGDNWGFNHDTLVEAWFFSVRKRKTGKDKAAHKAKVAAGAVFRNAMTAADTTMSPFPPGFAPTSGTADQLVGDIYAVRPGTNISTHLYHDRTWTGALTKIFTTLDKLGETPQERASRKAADAELKRQIHRAKWPAYMVRTYTLLLGNRGTRPMRGYFLRPIEIGQIPPDTRTHILTKGFPQMTLNLTRYWWVIREDGAVPGELLPVGQDTTSAEDLQNRALFWEICEPQIQ